MSEQILHALTQLRGKTIAHIVLKAGSHPHAQLFLVFTDGTAYEWYADTPIMGTSTLIAGGLAEVHSYMADQTIVLEV